MRKVATLDLVPGVLAGETRAIARLLSRAEAGDDEGRPALEAIFRHAGRAHVVGITGVPGSGKSVSPLEYHLKRASPPSPKPLSGLSFGPAIKPSNDIDNSITTLLMFLFPYFIRL